MKNQLPIKEQGYIGQGAAGHGLSLADAYQASRHIEFDGTADAIETDEAAWAHVNFLLPPGEMPVAYRNAFWRELYRQTRATSRLN